MPRFKQRYLWAGGAGALLVFFSLFFLPPQLKTSYTQLSLETENKTVDEVIPKTEEKVVHLDTPEPLKALYMTACVAGTPSWRESLKKLIEETELNAVVIDIKDATGVISFVDEELQPKSSIRQGCKVSDLKNFIASLHDAGIYVIGRISVFQDPYYTALRPDLAVKSSSTGGVWKDYKGLSFIDVGAKEYWDYIINISKSAYALGFDEINYDYVRFPSDGNISDIKLIWTSDVQTASTTIITKPEILKGFFSYLHETLTSELPDLKTSVDLFGMTTTVTNDMGIGQILENALPYFDYIAPMVYPSHYPKNWNSFANPADHPYEVVNIAMRSAVEREALWRESLGLATSTPSKMRPWLQDFNLGATYDRDKVRAQIQAVYDAGLTSWMVWSAGNKYTESAYFTENN